MKNKCGSLWRRKLCRYTCHFLHMIASVSVLTGFIQTRFALLSCDNGVKNAISELCQDHQAMSKRCFFWGGGSGQCSRKDLQLLLTKPSNAKVWNNFYTETDYIKILMSCTTMHCLYRDVLWYKCSYVSLVFFMAVFWWLDNFCILTFLTVLHCISVL